MAEVISYRDPVEGFDGYLAYSGSGCRLAAGGCRVTPGLTAPVISGLAARMERKQRILGLNVDGAKCGIDYDPRAPGKASAVRRFIRFLRLELRDRLSMGCDMGTRWEELERLAGLEGLPSVKYAIKNAQEISAEEFMKRIRLLEQPVGALPLGQRRVGHALAAAVLATARHLGLRRGFSVGLQGFGNLGRAAAESLVESGSRVCAIADEYGCVVDPRGLDVYRMLLAPAGAPVCHSSGPALRLAPDGLFSVPADILVLAAASDVLTPEQAAVLPTSAVLIGANGGLSALAERLLMDQGIVAVPGFVAGAGGPASMDALFAPERTPEPAGVLATIAATMHELVDDVLAGARDRGLPPRQVALDICHAAQIRPGDRPYGGSPYSPVGKPAGPRGRRRAPATVFATGS